MEIFTDVITNIDDDTKRLIKIFGIGVLILIVSFVLITLKRNFIDVNTEHKITKKIESLTGKYYKDYLHDAFTLKDLENKKSSGIEVDLYGLLYKLEYKKFSDFYLEKDDKRCNLAKTIIMIYPQAPYGVKDYKLDVKLDFSE